jgi:hypothetical protein
MRLWRLSKEMGGNWKHRGANRGGKEIVIISMGQ